jgi:excisionase family DNA binding protein
MGTMRGWLKVEEVATYSSVSKRTVEKWLKSGLRCSHLPSRLRLVKPQWVDEYLEKFAVSQDQVEQMANELVAKVQSR